MVFAWLNPFANFLYWFHLPNIIRFYYIRLILYGYIWIPFVLKVSIFTSLLFVVKTIFQSKRVNKISDEKVNDLNLFQIVTLTLISWSQHERILFCLLASFYRITLSLSSLDVVSSRLFSTVARSPVNELYPHPSKRM